MTDQSSVENRHIGHRTFLSGAVDSLAGVMPDTLDAGALCFVVENATQYQWIPGDSSASNSPQVIKSVARPNAGSWKPTAGVPSTRTINVPLNLNPYSYSQADPPTFPDAWNFLFLTGMAGDFTVMRQALVNESATQLEAIFMPEMPSGGRILSVVLTCQGLSHVGLPAILPSLLLLEQPAAEVSPARFPTASAKVDPSTTLLQYDAAHTITIAAVAGELGVGGLPIDPSARYVVRIIGEGGANSVNNSFDLLSLVLTVAP